LNPKYGGPYYSPDEGAIFLKLGSNGIKADCLGLWKTGLLKPTGMVLRYEKAVHFFRS
jgi:hypothetical protein